MSSEEREEFVLTSAQPGKYRPDAVAERGSDDVAENEETVQGNGSESVAFSAKRERYQA